MESEHRNITNNQLGGQQVGLAQLRGCVQQNLAHTSLPPPHALPPLKRTPHLQHVMEPIKRMSDEEIQAQAANVHRQSPVGSLQKRPRDKRPRLKAPTEENPCQEASGKAGWCVGKPENIHALDNPHLMNELLSRSSQRRLMSMEGYVAAAAAGSEKTEPTAEPQPYKPDLDPKRTLSKQLLKVNELSKKYQKSRPQSAATESLTGGDGGKSDTSTTTDGCGDDCAVQQHHTNEEAVRRKLEDFAGVEGASGGKDDPDDDCNSIPEELLVSEHSSWLVSRDVSPTEDVTSDEALLELPIHQFTGGNRACNSVLGNVMIDVVTLRSLGLESLAAEITQARKVSEELYEAKVEDILSGRRAVEIKGFCGSLDSLLCLYEDTGLQQQQQQQQRKSMKRNLDSEDEEWIELDSSSFTAKSDDQSGDDGEDQPISFSDLRDDDQAPAKVQVGIQVDESPPLPRSQPIDSQQNKISTTKYESKNEDAQKKCARAESPRREKIVTQDSRRSGQRSTHDEETITPSLRDTPTDKSSSTDRKRNKASPCVRATNTPLSERVKRNESPNNKPAAQHRQRADKASNNSPEREPKIIHSQHSRSSDAISQCERPSKPSICTPSKESPQRGKVNTAACSIGLQAAIQIKCNEYDAKPSPHDVSHSAQHDGTNPGVTSGSDEHMHDSSHLSMKESHHAISDKSTSAVSKHTSEDSPASGLTNNARVHCLRDKQDMEHTQHQIHDQYGPQMKRANHDCITSTSIEADGQNSAHPNETSGCVVHTCDDICNSYSAGSVTDDYTKVDCSLPADNARDSNHTILERSTSCGEIEKSEAGDNQKCKQEKCKPPSDDETEDTESTKNITFLWQQHYITINGGTDFSSNNHKTNLEEQKHNLMQKVAEIEGMLDQLLLEREDLASKCSSTELEMLWGEAQLKTLGNRMANLTSSVCAKAERDGAAHQGVDESQRSVGDKVKGRLDETASQVQTQKDQVESLTSDIDEFQIQLNLNVSEEEWREDRDQELVQLKRRVSELESKTVACADLEARYKENVAALQQQVDEMKQLRLNQTAIQRSNEKLREEIKLTKKESTKRVQAMSEDLAGMQMTNVTLTDSLQQAKDAKEKAQQNRDKTLKMAEAENMCNTVIINIREELTDNKEVADLIACGSTMPDKLSTGAANYSNDTFSGSSAKASTSSSKTSTSSIKRSPSGNRLLSISGSQLSTSSTKSTTSSTSTIRGSAVNTAIDGIRSLKAVIHSALTDSAQLLKSDDDDIEELIVVEEIDENNASTDVGSFSRLPTPMSGAWDADKELHREHLNEALQHLDVLLKMKFEVCLTFISDLKKRQPYSGQKDTVKMLKNMFSWVFEDIPPREEYTEKIGEAREKIKRIKEKTEQVRERLENDYSKLMGQITALQAKQDILKQQIADKTKCYNMLKEKYVELDRQYQKLQISYRDALAEQERLEKQIQMLSDEKEQVLAESKLSFSKIQALDEDYDEKHRVLQEAFNKVAEEKDALKNKIRLLEKEKHDLCTSSEDSLKQLSAHKQDRHALQAAFDDLLTEKEDMVRRMSVMERDRQASITSQETWTMKFRKLDEEYEEKHRAVQEAFNRVSEEKDTLKARVVTLERENKELTVKELEVEEEFNKLQELYTQEHNSREEVIHKLLEEKDRLQKCIKRLQLEDGEASNVDLAKGIEELHNHHKRDVLAMKSSLERLVVEKEGLAHTLEQLRRQLNDMRDVEDKANAKLLEMQNSHQATEARFGDEREVLNSKIKRLESENKEVKESEEEWRKKVQRLDDEYQEEHERVQAAVEKVTDEKDAMYKQLQLMEVERKDLMQTKEGMQEQLEHAEQDRRALQESLAQISEDKEKLLQKIERLEKIMNNSDHDLSIWDDKEEQYKHDNRVLQLTLETVTSEKDELINKITTMEEELRDLQMQKVSLQALSEEKEQLQKQIADLELEVSKLNNGKREEETRDDTCEKAPSGELLTLKDTLGRMTRENARLESWINELEHRKVEQPGTSKIIDTKLEQLEILYKDELKQLKSSLEKVTKEKDVLAKQLNQNQHNLHNVEKSWKEKFERLEARYEENAEDLHASFKEVAEEKDLYKDQICNIDQIWKQKVQQLQEQYEQDKYSSEQKLEEANEARCQLEDELALLRREKRHLQLTEEVRRKQVHASEKAEMKQIMARMEEMHQTNMHALQNDMDKVVKEKESLQRKLERLKRNKKSGKSSGGEGSEGESFDDVYNQDEVVNVYSMKNSSGLSSPARHHSSQGSQTPPSMAATLPHVDITTASLEEICEEEDAGEGVNGGGGSGGGNGSYSMATLPSQEAHRKPLSVVDKDGSYQHVRSKSNIECKRGMKKVKMASDTFMKFKNQSDEQMKILIASQKSLQHAASQSQKQIDSLQESQKDLINDKKLLQIENKTLQKDKEQLTKDNALLLEKVQTMEKQLMSSRHELAQMVTNLRSNSPSQEDKEKILLEASVEQLTKEKQKLENDIRQLEEQYHDSCNKQPPSETAETTKTGIQERPVLKQFKDESAINQLKLTESLSTLQEENQRLMKMMLSLNQEQEQLLKSQNGDTTAEEVAKLREEKDMYQSMVHILQRERMNGNQGEGVSARESGTSARTSGAQERLTSTPQFVALLTAKERLEAKVHSLETERQQLLASQDSLQKTYKELERQKLEKRVHLLEDERQDLISALETWQENFRMLEQKMEQQVSRQSDAAQGQYMSQPISALFGMFKQIISHVVSLTNAQSCRIENDRLTEELHSLVQMISSKLQLYANENRTHSPPLHAHYDMLVLQIEQEYDRRLKAAEQKLLTYHRNHGTDDIPQSERILQLTKQVSAMKKVMQEVVQDTTRQFYQQQELATQKMEAQHEMELEMQQDRIKKLERAREQAVEKQVRSQGEVDDLKHQLQLKVQELAELTRALHKTSTLYEDLKADSERDKTATEQLESKLNGQSHKLREREVEIKEQKAKIIMLEQKLQDQTQEKISNEEKANYEISSLKQDNYTLRNNMKDEKAQLLGQIRRTKKKLLAIETNKDIEIDALTSRLRAANEILLKLRRETIQDLEECENKRSKFHEIVDKTRKMSSRRSIEAWAPESITPFNNLNKLTQQLGEIESLHKSINNTLQNGCTKQIAPVQSNEEIDSESTRDGSASCSDSIASEP